MDQQILQQLFLQLIEEGPLSPEQKQAWVARVRAEGGSTELLQALQVELQEAIAAQETALDNELKDISTTADQVEAEFKRDFAAASKDVVVQARQRKRQLDEQLLEQIRRQLRQ